MRVIPFKGEKGGVVVSHTNVSARKIAENELRKAEQKYRTVLDFTYDWEYWEAPDGSLIYVSPSCERITGYRVFEFMARPELISEIIIPDDRSIWKDHYHGLQAGSERHPSHCHFRIQHKDGSTRWIAHVCQPVFDDRAKYSGVRASNRDITKLRMVEQKVREHREMLTQQDRRETLGQLAGSIAHELNQPLTGILSDAQAGELLLEKGKLSKAETGEIFTDIIADAKRASGVLRNLRELYGDKNFKFSSLHLNSLVNDTIRILNSELVGQGVTVTTDLSENLPKIHGNRIQLQQVLMNLITNARQAMREGMNENQWISIQTLLGNDGMIEVCVEDNGPGIELELLTKIFEPLATTKETGLGMGLAISKSIIQAHGGRIWAEKSLHAGTRFHVSLPAEEEKS